MELSLFWRRKRVRGANAAQLGLLQPVDEFAVGLFGLQKSYAALLAEGLEVAFGRGVGGGNHQHLASRHAIEGLLGFEQGHRAGETTEIEGEIVVKHAPHSTKPRVKNRVKTGNNLYHPGSKIAVGPWPRIPGHSMHISGSTSRSLCFLALTLTVQATSAQVRLPVLGDALSGTIST